MATLANRAKVITATTGTGTITLGSAVSGFQDFTAAGVPNGATVSYVIEEGTAWEVGTGTYSTTGPTLTRTPNESSNAGSAINLAGAAQVFLTAASEDLQNAADMDQGVATTDTPIFAGATVNGNITVTGTVDGRDVAADGTKLDGIEASADVTDTTNVTAAGALMDSEVTNLAAVKAFDPTDYATAAQGSLADSAVQPNDSPTFAGGTLTGDLSFGDNDKAIFGAGSDLQIYHDGSNSYIDDLGTGNLYLDTNGTSIRLRKGSGGETMLMAIPDDGVYLYYDASEKLSTTATGVSVTGNITVTGTVDGRDVATDGSKLDGIESGAEVNPTASELLTSIKTVDGSSSGLDADLLDGQQGSYYLDYNNFSNTPSIPSSPNNATITLAAGTGLSGGGSFTTNQSSNETITFNASGGGFGYDQSWTNVTSSRSENTTYTNSTGKPIMVNVESNTASSTITDTTTIEATVDSVSFTVAYHLSEDDGRTVRSRTAGNFIVPSGSTYSVDVTGNTVSTWHELR